MSATTRIKNRRLAVRLTADDRMLLDRAASASGTDLTTFVMTHLIDAARRVLADRTEFFLTPEQAEEWERINDQPERDLPGLQRLLQRPSPFVAGDERPPFSAPSKVDRQL